MKNIFKFLFLALLVPLFLQSCRDENYNDWTTPEGSFKLYNTTLAANVLYPTMEANPFRLSWDNTTGATGDYTVQMSTTEDFAKPVVLGTAKTNTYTSTIGQLNDALVAAGYQPYKAQRVYMRVMSGTSYSNVISFDVTPYPAAVPVISAPAAGTKLILDSTKPDETATRVTWNDYSYGTDVVYVVEAGAKGSSNYVTVGSVNNLHLLNISNKAMNDALTGAGFTPNVAQDVDIRVTATTKSAGGTIVKSSNPVTISVTPYVSFKNMYLVGEATQPGWNTNNGNPALFRDPTNTNKFYYEGYFAAGGFKVLERLGTDTWTPQYGQNGTALGMNDGTGSDPNPFNIPTAGYYRFEMNTAAKTFSITPIAAPTANYASIGLIGDFNNWSADLVMTRSTFDSHKWVARNVVISAAGELKFRADKKWDNNWGNNTKWSGIATSGGPNIPVEAGTYDIFFNDADGSYIFIKK